MSAYRKGNRVLVTAPSSVFVGMEGRVVADPFGPRQVDVRIDGDDRDRAFELREVQRVRGGS